MTAGVVPARPSPFDAIRRVRPDGSEYWSARDLMPLLEYVQWRRFEETIDRARESARVAGISSVDAAFRQVVQLADAGNLGEKARSDFEMSRYAAYLVAMNGDVRKPAIAAAQSYFAVRAREAETRPAASALPDMGTAEGQVVVAEMLLRLAQERLEQEREIQRQRARLDWAEPRATYTDTFVDGAGDAALVRVVAQQLGVPERRFREWMMGRGLIYRTADGHGGWVYHPRAQLGPRRHWFVVRDQPEAPRLHNGQLRTTLYVTPAGKVGLADLLVKHPIGVAA